MKTIHHRLFELETAVQRQAKAPWRIFSQSIDNPSLFFAGVTAGEEIGAPWSEAAIDALSGVTIKVMYGEEI